MVSPAYLHLLENGELERRAKLAAEHLLRCDLCPWECKSDRIAGLGGICHTGALAQVHSYRPHLGEEDPLRGSHGSGTIFFSGCNLCCQYCQNYAISQTVDGRRVDAADLAAIMLELQAIGCHNINLVTPSHVTAQILAAVMIAAQAGLRLPLVYNTGGYDAPLGHGRSRALQPLVDPVLGEQPFAADARTGDSPLTHQIVDLAFLDPEIDGYFLGVHQVGHGSIRRPVRNRLCLRWERKAARH